MSYRDLQFDWLQCLVAVVDAGSLSGAAGEVHRSQSAVSMQLKKLEDAVGHRLLERDARKQHLTPEGETLLGYARRILELHAEAHDALNGDALTGQVRLGVPDDYAARYLRRCSNALRPGTVRWRLSWTASSPPHSSHAWPVATWTWL